MNVTLRLRRATAEIRPGPLPAGSVSAFCLGLHSSNSMGSAYSIYGRSQEEQARKCRCDRWLPPSVSIGSFRRAVGPTTATTPPRGSASFWLAANGEMYRAYQEGECGAHDGPTKPPVCQPVVRNLVYLLHTKPGAPRLLTKVPWGVKTVTHRHPRRWPEVVASQGIKISPTLGYLCRGASHSRPSAL